MAVAGFFQQIAIARSSSVRTEEKRKRKQQLNFPDGLTISQNGTGVPFSSLKVHLQMNSDTCPNATNFSAPARRDLKYAASLL